MKDIQKSEYGICSAFVLIIPGVLVMFYLCSVWGEHCKNIAFLVLLNGCSFNTSWFFVITFSFDGWLFVITFRGVVFMHHCCKNGTIFRMLHKCHTFFSMIEDISVSLCFKNSNLVAKCLINILKCLSKVTGCESHPPLPSTYIYTNTQKWFFKG